MTGGGADDTGVRFVEKETLRPGYGLRGGEVYGGLGVTQRSLSECTDIPG